jgi:hypothetical protein
MALSPGLAQFYILMVRITQLPYCRPAFLANHSHFATWQNNRDPVTFLGHNSCRSPGASNQLSALARPHFYIMNIKAGRNRHQRHRIANRWLAGVAAYHPIPHLHTEWRQYVPFLSVGVVQQRYETIPVRIVFNSCYLGRDAIFVPLKINNGGFFHRLSLSACKATSQDC